MKTQILLLISITASLVLSLVATLASYNIVHRSDPGMLDAAWAKRGWPLHWMIESLSFWSPPPYSVHYTFQPENFIVDFVFYTIVFLIPTQIYMYLRKTRKPENHAGTRPSRGNTNFQNRTAAPPLHW